ncbi:MAG: Transposase IS4 [Candidatus Woesebacteria bacterium GW2011_GWA1_33_30]|uniref:Transposase IS4 n=1 Tax=Candidatus Woesebacteria bacterium GW2011_GWA2_33_28 TaxID=1618561 RepID=A0A0G0A3T5_9BACT|nr:MAG: Transposase IS4 [Candidatus Woesebacteria bacterium GW2011_GWA2_33_28]KKP46301.1 MAG: Transposase IS4 [Candidatus Woesebacteria bacterium GW2011_GWA1_33_30]
MSKSLCSKELYCSFLKVTSQRYSSLALSEVSPFEISHDSISRWLEEAKCQPKDIWSEVKDCVLGSESGVIVADETVLNKNRSNKIELVRWQYSGTVHDILRGIGMLNFLWVDENRDVCPMDFRIWEPKEDGQTKNDQFREMLKIAKRREVKPEAVVADSWYGSLDNCKCIRDLGWNWVIGLRKNRVVNKGEKLEKLLIPESGLKVHLRGYGFITVFRFVAKNGRTDYFGTNIENVSKDKIVSLVGKRWQIEVFHKELKQTCGLECSQARTSRSQRNHIVLSVLSWIKKQELRRKQNITFYRQKWNIIKQSVAQQLEYELLVT